ncbi:hypothetical protein PIB30_082451 [Stylosanthes scabra]|uniref:Uncharacterized protein n=1 Tax=Stylosanthes scabra TaxID=79078 RepID=A0ABU6TSM8_9FABA|nr:hypothetical protein [Stylosanthes scabra]
MGCPSLLKSEACCLNHGQLMFTPNQSMEHVIEKLAELSVLHWLGMKSRLGSLGVQRGWSHFGLVRNQAPNVTCDTNHELWKQLGACHVWEAHGSRLTLCDLEEACHEFLGSSRLVCENGAKRDLLGMELVTFVGASGSCLGVLNVT